MTESVMIDYKNLTAYESLLPCLKVIVDELLEQGFRVFVEKREERYREINTAQVCLDFEGSFAEVGTWRLFSYRPMLSVPIKPTSKNGYAGKEPIEPGDTLETLIEALRVACLDKTVTVKSQHQLPNSPVLKVRNIGKNCLQPGGAYSEGFVEIALDRSDKEVEL